MIPTDLAARVRVWLERPGGYVLGAPEARLLEAIERAGSIKEGAEAANMSYRTAWARVHDMEHTLGRPMVQSRAGGAGGGATALTDDAREILRLFHDIDQRMEAHLNEELARVLVPV